MGGELEYLLVEGKIWAMLKSRLILLLTLGAAVAVAGETLELKDKASISGRILEEKRDQIYIDVGYTVLAVPRSQVVKIVQGTGHEDKTAKAAIAASETVAPVVSAHPVEGDGFYSVATSPLPEKSVRDLVRELGAAVVQVRTPEGLGSGFFINEDGYLMTNFHVTEGETQISVEVFQQRDGQIERKIYKQVRIVALNKFRDLALLHVEDKDAPKFAHVVLGDSESLAVGEPVFAIGSPLGLERTVTQGIISTKTREIEGELYLQTTTQINPGNSGGPLFNMRGEVVGVTNMKITFGEGLGFAIPVEMVKYVLNHRDSFAYDNDNPSNPYRYLVPPSRTHKTVGE